MRRIVVAVDESPASGRAAAFVNVFFGHDEDVTILAVNVARVPVEWLPPVGFGGLYPWPWGPQGGGVLPDDVIRETEARAKASVSDASPGSRRAPCWSSHEPARTAAYRGPRVGDRRSNHPEETVMRRRRTLSRKDRRTFDQLVRMFNEFEARDPAAGEIGPPTPRPSGLPLDGPPRRPRGEGV